MASGIGLETSKAFAQAGVAKLVLLARSQGPMSEAKKDVEAASSSTKVETSAASITHTSRINEIVKPIGRIDFLVLNAATMPKPGAVLDIDPNELDSTYAVTVYGPLNLIKAFHALPDDDKANPRTILYASTAGVTSSMAGTGVDNSSKLAIAFLMHALNDELGGMGLRAYAFHPAVAFTPLIRDVLGLKDSVPYDNNSLNLFNKHFHIKQS